MAIPIMMVAGAAISAAAAVSQANAQKAAGKYNAQLRERDATVALQQSTQDALRVRRRGEEAQGSLLAGYGAAGVVSTEGSPLDVLQASAMNAKLDEETVLYKGKLKATGYHDDAALSRFGADRAGESGNLTAASYLIGGAGKAASSYYSSRQPLMRVGETD